MAAPPLTAPRVTGAFQSVRIRRDLRPRARNPVTDPHMGGITRARPEQASSDRETSGSRLSNRVIFVTFVSSACASFPKSRAG